jgi:hypothetical protein
MSGNLSFIIDHPIILQLNILTNLTTILGVYLFYLHKDLVGSLLIGQLKI